MTEWSMTSSAGMSGLIRWWSPPRSAIASRIATRSTTHGTPVKSCRRTRAGVNWISGLVSAFASQAPSALTCSAETSLPSSLRSRFSSSTFRLYGSRCDPLTRSSRNTSYAASPTLSRSRASKLFASIFASWHSVRCGRAGGRVGIARVGVAVTVEGEAGDGVSVGSAGPHLLAWQAERRLRHGVQPFEGNAAGAAFAGAVGVLGHASQRRRGLGQRLAGGDRAGDEDLLVVAAPVGLPRAADELAELVGVPLELLFQDVAEQLDRVVHGPGHVTCPFDEARAAGAGSPRRIGPTRTRPSWSPYRRDQRAPAGQGGQGVPPANNHRGCCRLPALSVEWRCEKFAGDTARRSTSW